MSLPRYEDVVGHGLMPKVSGWATGLRLVTAKAISEISVVRLVPTSVGRGLSTTIAGVAWDLAEALLSHLWLLPAPSSSCWSYRGS